jgi:hypothetical protein
VFEFESTDPRFRGEMKIITCLREVAGGTGVTLHLDDIPPASALTTLKKARSNHYGS